MDMGMFTLHRFNGIEQFTIAEAKVYVVENDDKSIMLWLEMETDEQPLRSVPDTADCGMNPSGEITIYLDHLQLGTFGERTFPIPNGYDEKSRSLIAGLYYFEHQEVNDNTLHLAYKGNGVFQARWTGVTTDIAYYDGSKPDTKIEVSGDFFFEDYKDWQ